MNRREERTIRRVLESKAGGFTGLLLAANSFAMEFTVQSEKICCPRCGSSEISKSRRRGIMEKYLSNITQMRPYRCYECSLRFWKKRNPLPAHDPETQIEAPQSYY